MKMNRRNFLKGVAATIAGVTLLRPQLAFGGIPVQQVPSTIIENSTLESRFTLMDYARMDYARRCGDGEIVEIGNELSETNEILFDAVWEHA